MNELKTIKIVISLIIIFLIIGGVLIWHQGWLDKISLISDNIRDKVEKVSILKLIPKLTGFEGERNYLLLFQNDLELRPTGGYIGTFGIMKVKDGEPVKFEIHDTTVFDGYGKIVTEPPYALKTYLNIDNWQMRDGNWSVDFPTSASQVEYFYYLQGGREEFDGIIGINTTVLQVLLKLTGPIYLEEFDKEFKSNNVLFQVEYEVEKGYIDRGIIAGERKSIFKSLVHKILDEITEEDIWQSNEFSDLIFGELNNKNILIFLKDIDDQEIISKLNWSGEVNQDYDENYLMLVEANLMGLKSNANLEREVEYFVDYSKEKPEADLKIKFKHLRAQKDWFSNDYKCYLRIFAPFGSYLTEVTGVLDQTGFFDEFNRTSFGNYIVIPAGEEKTVEFKFTLPETYKEKYNILIQKQSGVNEMPVKYIIKDKQGQERKLEEIIKNDWEGVIQ